MRHLAVLGLAGCHLWALSTGGIVGSQETPWPALCWPGGEVWSVYSHSSDPSHVVCLGFGGPGWVPQPHAHALEFSQWCLVHEEMLVLVGGSEVRNDL